MLPPVPLREWRGYVLALMDRVPSDEEWAVFAGACFKAGWEIGGWLHLTHRAWKAARRLRQIRRRRFQRENATGVGLWQWRSGPCAR